MTRFRRTVVVVLAFLAGVVVDVAGVVVWIETGFECPGPPCDSGPLLAFGTILITAPVAGLLCATAAMVWMTIAARRIHPNRIDSP